jgi:hypothetical protein
LLAVYFHKDFVDVERVTVASMLSSQATGVNGYELDTPEANRLPSDNDAAFSEQVLDIAVTEIEAIVEPACTRPDVATVDARAPGKPAPGTAHARPEDLVKRTAVLLECDLFDPGETDEIAV